HLGAAVIGQGEVRRLVADFQRERRRGLLLLWGPLLGQGASRWRKREGQQRGHHEGSSTVHISIPPCSASRLDPNVEVLEGSSRRLTASNGGPGVSRASRQKGQRITQMRAEASRSP